MADKEIGNLTAASTLTGAELVHVVQSGNSRKATVNEVAGKAILADIDLSSRDLRTGQNPLVITGIDDYERIDVIYDGVTASNCEITVHMSNDGGSTYKTTSGDYGRSYFNATLNQADLNDTAFVIIGSGAAASAATIATIYGHNRSTIQTVGYSHVTASANHLTSIARVRTREVNDAIRFTAAQTTTAGRLIVIGYR